MSEANSPFHSQGLPESSVPDHAPDLAWQDFPMTAVEGFSANADGSHASDVTIQAATEAVHQALLEEVQALQPLDLLNGADLDELERQLFEDQIGDEAALADAIAPELTAELTRPVGASAPLQPTNVSELISLIQELNQCNSILLDRVSQLEEALDRSETALQSELGRSLQDQPKDLISTSELLNAQERIKHLVNQLEFANQTNQRQQILIETLSNQLESNQERLAELEREAALLQQRFEVQAHLLTQSETTCRDLRARLQRQQRYTLQYKAALEKCLEVPPPNYESTEVTPPAPETPETADAFLPKAQRIRPWTAHPQDLAQFPTPTADDFISGDRAAATSQLKFSAPMDTEASEPMAESIALPCQPEVKVDPEPAKPIISYQIHAAEHRKVETASPSELSAPTTQASSHATESHAIESHATEELTHQAAQTSEASTPLNEEGFWQDLARLIDVSAEDVVKASVAGNFDEFAAKAMAESTHPSATCAEPEQSDVNGQPATPVTSESPKQPAPQVTQTPAKAASRSLNLPAPATRVGTVQEDSSGQKPPAVLTAHPSWPSPVVYPLRSAKKRASLAAVDLPSFPRSGSQV